MGTKSINAALRLLGSIELNDESDVWGDYPTSKHTGIGDGLTNPTLQVQGAEIRALSIAEDGSGDLSPLDLELMYRWELKEGTKAKTIKTNIPHLELLVCQRESLDRTNGFMVFLKDTQLEKPLVGVLQLVRGLDLPKTARNFINPLNLYVPHSSMLPAYRSKGYAKAMYNWALQSGMSLMSFYEHTTAANRIWKSLASTWPTVLVDTRKMRIIKDPRNMKDPGNRNIRLLMFGKGHSVAQLTELLK